MDLDIRLMKKALDDLYGSYIRPFGIVYSIFNIIIILICICMIIKTPDKPVGYTLYFTIVLVASQFLKIMATAVRTPDYRELESEINCLSYNQGLDFMTNPFFAIISQVFILVKIEFAALIIGGIRLFIIVILVIVDKYIISDE